MRPEMRVLRAILGIRFGTALLALGTLVVVAAASGLVASSDQTHTGITTRADSVSAPTVMVHADRPTPYRARCVWTTADSSLLICHSPSAELIYEPKASP
jgi:hypothetical protein